EIEGGMYGSQCSRCFSLFDDGGDVSFRRSLRDCPDVNAGLSERTKKLSGHAQALDHAIAYHRDDATTICQIHRLNLSTLHLDNKRLFNRLLRERCVYARNREADRMLRARL